MTLASRPNLPGFFVKMTRLPKSAVPDFLVAAYDYAWFLGFAVAFLAYLLFKKLASAR